MTNTLAINITGEGKVQYLFPTPKFPVYSTFPPLSFHDVGRNLALYATPDPGWGFSHWGGDASGTTSPLPLLMDGDKNITATFIPIALYYLNISKLGHGTVAKTPKGTVAKTPKVTVAKRAKGYPYPKNPNKSYFPLGTTVQLTATPARGYQFSGWGGDAASTNTTLDLLMEGNKDIAANFIPLGLYDINIAISGRGKVGKTPKQASYQPGTIVQLTATPDLGWTFSHWSGDAYATNNTLNMTLDGDRAITAIFIRLYSLNITIQGPGTVTKSPDLTSYPAGTSVQLKDHPPSGYQNHWSGDIGDALDTQFPLTVIMDDNKTITANFVQLNPLIITTTGAGTVWVGVGTDDDKPYSVSTSYSYMMGRHVRLSANADPGSTFSHWSGDASGISSSTSLLMNGYKNITANFSILIPF